MCPLISVMLHIPVDCGGHEHKIGSQQVLDEWEWNGCCLVNTYQLCLLQFVTVPRVNILESENFVDIKTKCNPSLTHNPPLLPQETHTHLNCLPVVVEYVHSHNSFVKLWVSRLY